MSRLRRLIAVAALAFAAPLPAVAQNAKPIPITIAQATDSIIHGPLYIAQAKHYFEDQGLDVKVVIIGNATNAVNAVLSGSAQIASTGMADDVLAASHGKPLVAFATLTRQDPDNIVIAKKVAEAKNITPATPLAARVAALKGLKIGISSIGASTDQVLHWLLATHGINPDKDVQTVPVHDSATALGALRHGEIDAFIFGPPAPEAAVKSGDAVVLVDLAHGEVKPGYQIDLMSSRAYLDANGDVLDRVTRAIARAESFIQSDPQGAQAALRPFFPKMPAEAFALAWTDIQAAYAASPVVSAADVASVVDFMGVVSGKKPNIDPASLQDNKFAAATK